MSHLNKSESVDVVGERGSGKYYAMKTLLRAEIKRNDAQAAPAEGTGGPRRAFAGVLGIVPDADQPEHVAYVDYERELEKRLAEVEAILHKTFDRHD